MSQALHSGRPHPSPDPRLKYQEGPKREERGGGGKETSHSLSSPWGAVQTPGASLLGLGQGPLPVLCSCGFQLEVGSLGGAVLQDTMPSLFLKVLNICGHGEMLITVSEKMRSYDPDV